MKLQEDKSEIHGTPEPPNMGRTVIVGLGNLLMRDDGVGVHAILALERSPPPGVELADAGTAMLHALEVVAGAKRVVAIDAVHAGGEPGTVYELDGYETAESGRMSSLHAMGLRSALHLLPASEQPGVFKVIGVEPASVECGLHLSPAVVGALPRVVDAVRRTLSEGLQD